MSHLKREKVPRKWPIPRKGTTFVVKPKQKGVPILILLRDMLKIAQNRKEVKRAIHKKNILLNKKEIKDEKESAKLFDVLTLVPSKKNYKLSLSDKGKFNLEEIKEAEANFKVSKIKNKTILKGKKVQLNFEDGKNFLSNLKCKVNDSALINLKDKKIEKCLGLKDNSRAMVFAGKHTGKKGIINKIEGKTAEIKIKDKNVKVLIKQLMVIE